MLGSQTEATPEHLLAALGRLPMEVRNLGVAASARIGPRLAGGEVYTDDRAPVEWLIDRSILGYAGDN